MELSRPEYWSGLPFLSSGNLPNSGIEPRSPAMHADSLLSKPPGKPRNWKLPAECYLGREFMGFVTFSRSSMTQESWKTQAGSTGQVAVGCSSGRVAWTLCPMPSPRTRRPGERQRQSQKAGPGQGAWEDGLVASFPWTDHMIEQKYELVLGYLGKSSVQSSVEAVCMWGTVWGQKDLLKC